MNGVKTWATFAGRADVLMLLARTDPDRSQGHRGLSVFIVEKPRAEGHAFQFDERARRKDGGPRDRHDRLPRHALLRGRVRGLVRARREPHRRRRRARPWLLPADGRVRERPPADRGARGRSHAGRVRSRARYAQERKVFGQTGVRLPALDGEARPHGRAHPGRPAVLLRRRAQDGRAAKARSKRRW